MPVNIAPKKWGRSPLCAPLSIMIAGPIEGHADGRLWRWSVRHQIVGSVPVAEGSSDTQPEAWAEATAAGVAWLADRCLQ